MPESDFARLDAGLDTLTPPVIVGQTRPLIAPTTFAEDHLHPDDLMGPLMESLNIEDPRKQVTMTTTADLTPAPKHPAKFSPSIIAEIGVHLDNYLATGARVLDPFAGVGGIHRLRPEYRTVGVELESEWASQHPGTLAGDSTQLHTLFAPDYFDAIATSPAYGNRMADSYDGRDGSRRHTYRIDLGRPLSPTNGGSMHWGERYRDLHEQVWVSCDRVLKPGGIVILNCANHIRKGEEQPVTEFHMSVWLTLGYYLETVVEVATPRMREGANRDLRCTERLVVFRKPGGTE